MPPLVAALLSISGALIVAILSHVLSQRRRQRDELAELQLKAYSDFITAISRLIASRRLGQKTDSIEDLAKLNDAKTRICLCAPASVVHALAEYWEQGGTLELEGEVLAFTRFCWAVRESLGSEDLRLKGFDLSHTLFRIEPATFSFKADHVPASWDKLLEDAKRADGDA
jgi:type II secretory pathway pseudopilin PulG